MPSTRPRLWHSLSLSLALSPHLVAARSAGVTDPRSWSFGSEPAHEYVVRTRASRLRTLSTVYGDEHSGIRRLESRWAVIASSTSLSQMLLVLLASEGHQTHPPNASLSASSSSSPRHLAASHCQTAWDTGQLSMTWLRVAS